MITQEPVTQDTINQRLGELIIFLIDSRKINSQAQFADSIGSTQSQVNAMMHGKGRNANPVMIGRTLQVYPDVNPLWLMALTDGPMLLEGNAVSKGLMIDQDYVELPYVKATMRATFVENIDSGTPPEMEMIRVLYVPPKVFKKGVVFEVDGDSMEPNYLPGARVLALPIAHGDWQYLSAGVYAVSFGSFFVIKRVKDNEIISKGILTLHSDSPDGGSLPVQVADIRAIWKVEQIVYSPAR